MLQNNKKIVIANWKMHGSVGQVDLFIEEVQPKLGELIKLIICPPAVFLLEFSRKITGANNFIGAQDCSRFAGEGAFTGEISADILSSVGCKYVIIGHSERRALESEEIIAQKLKSTLEAGLTPIFCVGEQSRQGDFCALLAKQCATLTKELSLYRDKFSTPVVPIIAYEPVWAIGTGLTPEIQHIESVAEFIVDLFPGALVLYGGSVKPGIARTIISTKNLAGLLVGGASLSALSLLKIYQEIEMGLNNL